MAAGTVNDLRRAYLIEQIMLQEELDDFVGPKHINDLEARYAKNVAAGLPEE